MSNFRSKAVSFLINYKTLNIWGNIAIFKQHIHERCIQLAEYIIRTKQTVRYAAKIFSISKSTVHKDVTERLKHVDNNLYTKVKEILEHNLSQRHIRGGCATKNKFKK